MIAGRYGTGLTCLYGDGAHNVSVRGTTLHDLVG
jgi:hypothetical protein